MDFSVSFLNVVAETQIPHVVAVESGEKRKDDFANVFLQGIGRRFYRLVVGCFNDACWSEVLYNYLLGNFGQLVWEGGLLVLLVSTGEGLARRIRTS